MVVVKKPEEALGVGNQKLWVALCPKVVVSQKGRCNSTITKPHLYIFWKASKSFGASNFNSSVSSLVTMPKDPLIGLVGKPSSGKSTTLNRSVVMLCYAFGAALTWASALV
jgi:hypothetical protein